MAKHIPIWLLKRLFALYLKFKDREFSFEEALSVLKEDPRTVQVVLSRLKQNGWLVIHKDADNKLKAIYRITNPRAVEEWGKAIDLR